MASIIASRPRREHENLPTLQRPALERRRRPGPRASAHAGDVGTLVGYRR